MDMDKDRGNDTFVGPSAFYCTVNVLMGLHSGQQSGSTSEMRGGATYYRHIYANSSDPYGKT